MCFLWWTAPGPNIAVISGLATAATQLDAFEVYDRHRRLGPALMINNVVRTGVRPDNGDSWYSVSSEARMAAAMMYCLTDGCVAVCGIGCVIWNRQSSTRLRNTVCVYVDNTP